MKIPYVFLPAVLIVLIASGCGPKQSPATTATVETSTSVPAPATAPRVIEITAGDNMKFSVTSIEAKPGEELKVILVNIGTLPKEAMGHNWVLLKKGADANAFATAAATAQATEYIPVALKDQVIAHTELIGPRKSSEVTFKAPSEPGEYAFLCSFLNHFFAGMKGVLVVK